MGNLSAAIREKANKIAEAIVAKYGATSVQYAVSYQNEIVLSGHAGVYSKTENQALTNQTMYGVGSVSKVYVAAAAMLLVDMGKLDIDKPLTTYIPEFQMADKRYVKITPRMLLNHSSGIYGTHFKNAMLFEDSDTHNHDNLLTALKVDILKQEPGEMSEYCNDGFTLLEILVERISGLRYHEYLEKYFFAPLGIKNTKTPLDSFDRGRMARGYAPMFECALPVECANVIGSGGIYSTAEDMCRFGQVLTGKKILSEASAKKMAVHEGKKGIWPKDDDANFFGYGLGWDSVYVPPFGEMGIQALCKGGDTNQYHASLICVAEHDVAVGVLSSGGSSIFNYCLTVTLMQEALKDLGFIDAVKPDATPVPPVKTDMPAGLAKYSGLYSENGKSVTIEIRDGEFELPSLLSLIPAQKYVYTGDGWFASADGSVSVTFTEQKNGVTFMQANILLAFPDVGGFEWKCFQYQRLEPVTLKEKIAAAWKNRDGKKYYLLDEKYTSQGFMSLEPIGVMTLTVDAQSGYAYGGCKIIDEQYAENVLKFRDIVDLRFVTENGVEYLKARGYTFAPEQVIPTLGHEKTVQIAPDGYTKYFKIGADGAGKTITVTLPKTGMFACYDEKGQCTNLTTVTGRCTATLAEGGLIAFAGFVGDSFDISLA